MVDSEAVHPPTTCTWINLHMDIRVAGGDWLAEDKKQAADVNEFDTGLTPEVDDKPVDSLKSGQCYGRYTAGIPWYIGHEASGALTGKSDVWQR